MAQLGPDLLGETFDRDEAIRRIVASGHRAIAQTLLDQRIVAGIGNVYKSEVLFMCGVNPFTLVCILRRHRAPCPTTRWSA